MAAGAGRDDWQNLATIRTGSRIQVVTKDRKFTGEYIRFDNDALTVREKSGERALARGDITKVSMTKRSRGIWIGVAAGAGTGAIAGGLLGARLANESGGDFANAKGPITGLTAAVGALIGALIGGAARRAKVVYSRP